MIDKEKLKELFRECFPKETHEYTERFFSEKVNEDNTVTIEEDGEVVGALYLIEKTLIFKGESVKLPFITGFGIAHKARGRGLSKKLMQMAIERCSDYPFVALYPDPVPHTFYEKMGFSAISFDYERECINATGEKLTCPRAYEIYTEYTKSLDYYIKRDEKEYERFYSLNPCGTFAIQDGYINEDEVIHTGGMKGTKKGAMCRIVCMEKARAVAGITGEKVDINEIFDPTHGHIADKD